MHKWDLECDPAHTRRTTPAGRLKTALHNVSVNPPGTVEYPLARAVRVRLLGAFVVALGLLVLVVTVVLGIAGSAATSVLAAAVVIVLVGAAGAVALARPWYVVRVDETGYRVRLVRGVGRSQARWAEVEDLTTTITAGTRCVVLRLRDGASSTIPVTVIEGDGESFVDELQRRLDTAHGYRRL